MSGTCRRRTTTRWAPPRTSSCTVRISCTTWVRSARTRDQDWYRLSQKPFSSYEIVADATSGDIGTTLNVFRTDDTGAPIQTSVPVGVGYSRSLRWINATSASEDTQRIEVTSGSCTTNCGADDVYRLRAYETTYAVPRFNNLGSQITVLLLQNPTNYTISGTVYFWQFTGVSFGYAGLHARAEVAARAQHVDGHDCQRRDDDRARRSLRRSVGQERRSGAVDRLQLRHSGAPPGSLSPGSFLVSSHSSAGRRPSRAAVHFVFRTPADSLRPTGLRLRYTLCMKSAAALRHLRPPPRSPPG